MCKIDVEMGSRWKNIEMEWEGTWRLWKWMREMADGMGNYNEKRSTQNHKYLLK